MLTSFSHEHVLSTSSHMKANRYLLHCQSFVTSNDNTSIATADYSS